MRVLVYEDNLLWSSRLVKSVQALGHEAKLVRPGAKEQDGDAAIVNLASQAWSVQELIESLKMAGVHTIGHAGHREADLLALGASAGCDVVATNSQITFKLDKLLGYSAAEPS